ncbi:MAG TPA: tetratricopeptide repeat protein [Acetobacteraceae bacterium]|nr:tetratricopeptide repeat protein [Acetobacteraceae bacterium]
MTITRTRRARRAVAAFPDALRHFRAGRLADAEALCLRILAVDPSHADSLHLLGIIAGRGADHQAAASWIRRAIECAPGRASYHNSLGNVLRQLGQDAAAIIAYREAVRLWPDFAEAHGNLGLVLREQGQVMEAIASLRCAVALKPDFTAAHTALGNALHDEGAFEEAVACHRRAIAHQPGLAAGYYNLANALIALGRVAQAVACYRRALELQPDYPEALTNLGNALHQSGNLAEAVACHQQAVALRPDYVYGLNNLGNALREQGLLDDAVACHRRAIALRPGYPEAHVNLGNELQEQGRLDEAVDAYELAVALAPRRAEFWHMLANTGRVAADSAHARRIAVLAAELDSLSVAEQMHLHFALGIVGQGKDAASSFRHLLEANRLKRTTFAYDEAATLAMFSRIRQTFTADFLASRRGTGMASPVPVFVVGMPRSGTTLVEQILASHKQVHGAGELPDLPRLLAVLERPDAGLCLPEAAHVLPPEAMRAVGAAYLDGVRMRAPKAARIVDKLPGNFLRLGLIHLALPQAKIIHIARDPVDTCLSCFAKLFSGHLPYAYDLAELGRFYRAYEGLMAHWREILPPGTMLELRYEHLVSDIETETRRLLTHCDLPWDDACLAFHENRRAVQTFSATQVRRPLYASSIGRWGAYGHLAGPLLEALRQ